MKMMVYIKDKCNNMCIFQQDSAIIYVSHKTKTFMHKVGMAVMKYPAYSPDLNPMENM